MEITPISPDMWECGILGNVMGWERQVKESEGIGVLVCVT